jgi:hypothetical protein
LFVALKNKEKENSMDRLTTRELAAFNNVTVKAALGTKLQEIIDHIGVGATAPVNAVAASKVLTIDGVVVDGETVTINNPAVTGTDIYEFLADTEQTKTHPTNIAVNIVANTTKATGALTLPTQPTSGDTMTIGTKVYTFVPEGTANADGEIGIGTNLASAKLAIVAAINGTDDHNTAHPGVTAAAFQTNVCTLTAVVGGVAGDAIATTESFNAVGNVFGAATLGSGVDCSAANAATALAAAITAHDTQGVGGVNGSSGVVTLTADVAGVVGNAIILAETLTNGSFAASAVLMSGGIDGTVGVAGEKRSDTSFLYVCIAANSKAGANWRRVALGSVY